jgi:hypothetical protein
MTSARSQLAAMPIVLRFAVIGSMAVGILGALVGLILGLRAYPPTAWFAVFEVGVPAGMAGAVVGAVVGLVGVVIRKVTRH